jgi:predicted  nucleic acid-binding Zn-ribbon protein
MQAVLQALLALRKSTRTSSGPEEPAPARGTPGRRSEIEKKMARLAEIRERAKTLRVRIKEIEDLTTTQRQRCAGGERGDGLLQRRRAPGRLPARDPQPEARDRERREEGLRLVEEVEGIEKGRRADGDRADEKASRVRRTAARPPGGSEARRAQALEEEMVADIPGEAMALYTRILASREGVATAELDGRICQACYMEIPVNLVVRVQRGTELVQCPSCDRILFLPS